MKKRGTKVAEPEEEEGPRPLTKDEQRELLDNDPGIKRATIYYRSEIRAIANHEGTIRMAGFKPNTVYTIYQLVNPPWFVRAFEKQLDNEAHESD